MDNQPAPEPSDPAQPSQATELPVQPRRRRRRWAAAAVGVAALATPIGIVTLSPAGSATADGATRLAPSGSTTTTDYRGRGYGYSYGYGYGYDGPAGLSGTGAPGYGTAPSVPTSPGQQSQQTQADGTSGTTSTATDAESTGLVEVDTVLDYGTGEAAGTGMVVGSDGIVVTNHHVVADATKIRVTVVSTGTTYVARLIGADAKHDVAVLKLRKATGLTTVTAAADPATKGETVTAVGDAGGDGGSLTAAPGTVTARHRSITVTGDDGTKTRLTDLIRVTSDIIPGDSGGALLDSDGDVVGMNVAASEGTADVTGYVIPVARVERIADRILAGNDAGAVTLGYPAFLGVELSTNAARPTVAGVFDGGAAAGAGVVAGDTLTSIDGVATRTPAAVRAELTTLRPGQSTRLTWTDSSGTAHAATVRLRRGPVA